MSATPRIAVFISFSGDGGVERMVTNLAAALVAAGYPVDMVLVRAEGGHVGSIPQGVRLVNLGARHTLTSLPGLIRYLRANRPAVLLAAKDRAIKVAVLARSLARVPTRIVGRLGTTLSAALEGRSWLKRQVWYASMRAFYRWADAIVAVSGGVAKDVLNITGLPRERMHIIRNPVVSPQMLDLARERSTHPWLSERRGVVILGVGRLTRQKDFSTLIRAFARLRRERPCRLIVLGEGRDRAKLESLVKQLGVAADVSLPGFAPNPYSYMARCDLFVLSSAWEGSPNTLTEALALGVPVVATDCPSGPREILQDGRYGKLVPVGDVAALTQAMRATLDDPPPPARLKEAVREYTVEASTRNYLSVMMPAAKT